MMQETSENQIRSIIPISLTELDPFPFQLEYNGVSKGFRDPRVEFLTKGLSCTATKLLMNVFSQSNMPFEHSYFHLILHALY